MYFILSKILLFIILPINWITAALILAFIVKNKQLKKRFAYTGIALAIVFTSPLLLDYFAKLWRVPNVPLTRQSYSCAIVLGGYAGGMDHIRGGYFGLAADRFIQGAELKIGGKVSHVLFSGGNGSLIERADFIESEWAKAELKKINVADSAIFSEGRSRNTFENAAFTKPILLDKKLKPPYLLVTSDVHMRRSLLIFKKAGIDVIPYSCNYVAGTGWFSLNRLLPDAEVLGKWNYYTKEVVGWVVTLLK